jgi:soluble lytic murein transglycosylase
MSSYPASSTAPEALEELKSIREKPLIDIELFEGAWVIFHQGRFDEAAQLWSRFAELYPEGQQAEEALYLSAQACYHGKQYSQAEAKCHLLLRAYPRSLHATSAHFLIARCAEADGRATVATKRYRQFAQDYSWSQLAEDALWRVAMLQEQRGRLHEAQREYQALSQKYASRERAAEALWRAGLFAFRLDEDAAAIALFDRLRVRYPQSPWAQGALYWGARAHRRSGGELLARQLLDQVVQIDPQGYYAARAKERLDEDVLSSVVRDSRGLEMHLDEEDRAAPGLDHAFASHLQRGRSLLQLGLLPYARRELSAVHLVAHEHPQVLRDLLRLYQKFQLYGDALRLAQQSNDHLNRPRWRESLEPFLYPLGYMETVTVEAGKYGLEPYFVMSVIRIESGFDPLAVSRTGARGLMQIMPSTEKEIGERLGLSLNPASSSFRPELNVRMGTYYLWRQLDAFGWQPEIALAAYNAGPGNVKRWLRRWGTGDPELFVEFIEFPETREFVKRVLATQALYRRIWSARG